MSNPGEVEVEEEVVTPDPAAERRAAAETEARRMGWRPYEEYRGEPGKWRSAEEFLERGKTILPIVRKDLERQREINSKMENEIQALRSTVDEQRQVMDDLLKMARSANEQGYNRAMNELKAQKAAAAAQGDVAAVVAIQDKIDEVREERANTQRAPEPKKPIEVPKVDPKNKPNPIVDAFIEDNPWFNTDPVLHKAMEAEHILLLQEAPGMSLEENLEAAKQIVMDRYPRKFGITPKASAPEPEEEEEEVVQTPAPAPKRRVAAVSAPSGPAGTQRPKATGIASIEDPQERQVAQQAFARAKRLIPDLKEADWFAIYQDPRRDILDIQRASKKG